MKHPALLISLVVMGCAQGATMRADGGSPRDGGGGIDAGSDASVRPDAGDSDGGVREDAAVPVPDGGPGTACTPANAAAVCGGRPCVDGYCCDEPCDGVCRGCAVPGAEGTCTSYGAGTDPESECPAEAPSTCGTTGMCDGAGACAFHPASVSCDDGEACSTGDMCDGLGTCRGAAPAECTPAAGNECCLGACGAGGCRTDAGSCGDVCGGSQLIVGRTCQGCGAPRAAGTCLGGATHVCDASSHSLCQTIACGGATYVCTSVGGTWAWRTALACDDGDPCTHGDSCTAGTCSGTSVTCASTTCMTRACNGTATCTETPNTGASCDDGDPCTYGEACNSSGVCASATSVTCVSSPCVERACNGTATCTETPRTGLSCDDGSACTTGETCNASGVCGGGAAVTCPPDTACRTYACNGTSTCVATARNVGGPCDDGDPSTPIDRCQPDGTCAGLTCPPSLTSVFSDAFASPSSSAWTAGTDAAITTSVWRAYTSAQHGARINGGLFEITNRRSGSPNHGQGYAYVRTGGAGSAYDNARYQPTLKANAGHEIVWSFNMRRDDPESTNGGFSCSSSSSQNDITVGLAYVLATDSAAGLNASASTCNASATARGYAVVMGGSSRRIRLVRFVNGLRNGTLTTIVESGAFTVSHHFSVRVSYNASTDQWRLEARSDGASSFANPAAGTYGFSGTGTDATYVNEPLLYSGPYFQTGCTGLCSSTYTARFDNVSVGVRCAP